MRRSRIDLHGSRVQPRLEHAVRLGGLGRLRIGRVWPRVCGSFGPDRPIRCWPEAAAGVLSVMAYGREIAGIAKKRV
jgi:hypothetical protein